MAEGGVRGGRGWEDGGGRERVGGWRRGEE